MSKRHLFAAVAMATFAIAGVAKAAADTLDLTGVVADSTYGTANFGGTSYSTWMLPLSGLDVTNAITVSQGDHIDGNIDLDQAFTVKIPQSNAPTFFDLVLTGVFPAGDSAPGP